MYVYYAELVDNYCSCPVDKSEYCVHTMHVTRACPRVVATRWDGTRVLDRATRSIQLKEKGGITQEDTRLNRDGGYELPGCWISTMKNLGWGANHATLVLVLRPLHRAARACKRSIHAYKVPAFLHLTSLMSWGWLEHWVKTSATKQ